MSFQKRHIELTFQLGEGAFGNTGFDTVIISGLRVSLTVNKAGGPSMGQAVIEVYGMTLSEMNRLSTLGQVATLVRRNNIVVKAGSGDEVLSTVFAGTITNAWVQFESAPDVAFHIEAFAGLYEAIANTVPSSFTGPVQVSTVMQGIADAAGLVFENDGVDQVLPSAYFSGSVYAQFNACKLKSGINGTIDKATLIIWPRNGFRTKPGIAEISPATGMVGYPSWTSTSVRVKTEFNKNVEFGSRIHIASSGLGINPEETTVGAMMLPADGQWIVALLDYELESEAPDGPWFTIIEAKRPGQVIVTPGNQ